MSANEQQQQRQDVEAAPAAVETTAQPNRGSSMPILSIGDSLMRFVMVVILSWVFFYSAMSANPKWTVETYIPWSFWLLHYLVMFGIVGGGWPLTAPFGLYGKEHWGGHGRLVLGLLMTMLVIGMAAVLSAFFVNVYPGYPMFGGGAFYGICLFYVSLWWVLNIQTMPKPLIPPHPSPPVNIALNSIIVILLALGVFQLADFEGPANADSSNPHGPLDATHLFALLVSIIVWVQCFASILVFQGFPNTPLHSLPHPMQHVVLTLLSIILGLAILEIVNAAGVDRGFYADAIGASQISGSLYHTVAFDFWPYHKLRQPRRGFYSFALSQVVFPFFWIWIMRTILQPIYDLMVEANPLYGALFTVHTMIPWFSLHVVAPLLLVHQSFFMRWPFPPAGPPLGPMDIGVEIPKCCAEGIEQKGETSHAGEAKALDQESKTALLSLMEEEDTLPVQEASA